MMTIDQREEYDLYYSFINLLNQRHPDYLRYMTFFGENEEDYDGFGANVANPNFDDVIAAGENFIYSQGYNIEQGASKIVFIGDDFHYVAKIPKNTWDGYNYCKLEWDIYCKARGTKFEKFFAPMLYSEFYNFDVSGEDLNLFLMLRGEIDEERVFNKSRCSGQYYEDRDDTTVIVREALEDIYGTAAIKALYKQCREWDINDLHCGNVAWFNNNLKFIDYSGFNYGKY